MREWTTLPKKISSRPRVMKEIFGDIIIGRKRQRRQHKKIVARDMHDMSSEHEKLKICRYRLRKGTKRQKMTKNWITFCIILELNPQVTQPEYVTQSSNLDVAMNSIVVKRI
jgi:hypothetical protein